MMEDVLDAPRAWTGLAWRLDSERTAPVKANQRLTVANPRPRRYWAAKVISATGKPGRGRGQLCISRADAL